MPAAPTVPLITSSGLSLLPTSTLAKRLRAYRRLRDAAISPAARRIFNGYAEECRQELRRRSGETSPLVAA